MSVVQPVMMSSLGQKKGPFEPCGGDLFLLEEDKLIPKIELPIVIVYNGRNHFCGTWVEDPQLVNSQRLDSMFHHLTSALDLYKQVVASGGLSNKPLQRNVALLMHNVATVHTLLESPLVPEEGVLLSPDPIVPPFQPPPSGTPATEPVTPATEPVTPSTSKPLKKKRKKVPSDPKVHKCTVCDKVLKKNMNMMIT